MATYSRTSSSAHSAQFGQPAQPTQRRHVSKQRFVSELSQCLYDFVIQLLPTAEEMAVKEDVRKLLERLIRTIEPNSRLLSFGSTGNGFALRNSGNVTGGSLDLCPCLTPVALSDMDLCCLIDSVERLSATDLVTMLGDLLERGMCHGSRSRTTRPEPMSLDRNEIPRKAVASCPHTHREAVSRSVTRPSVRDCLRYWFRKQACSRKHASVDVLCHGRPHTCADDGAVP